MLLVIPLLLCFASGAKAQTESDADDGVEAAGTEAGNNDKAAGNGAEKTEDDAVPSDAQQRELGADEDPLATSQAKRDAERAEEKPAAQQRTTGFDIYGSLRIRYRNQGGESEWQDGGSRMGADVDWQFRRGYYLFARYEAGFNLLTGVDELTQGGTSGEEFGDNAFTRLAYAGLDAPGVTAVAGKNWSTYYEVAAFTDRFMGTGGDASGAFNAQTDGGPTGPGRADDIIQTKLSVDFLPQRYFKPFDLNLQVQKGNPVPFGDGAQYGSAFGASAILTTQKDFTIGIAYNHAAIDLEHNPSLRSIGISGDARAAIIGTRGFGDRWYAGFVLARLEDHETTDDGIYFDGWGSEFYGQYQLFDRLWFVGGYNTLEPDSDQDQARSYRIRYAVAGLRYTFEDFRRMIYVNVRFDDSIDADGTPGGNIYTIGVRWDLSKLGWHISGEND